VGAGGDEDGLVPLVVEVVQREILPKAMWVLMDTPDSMMKLMSSARMSLGSR